jgi:hypothetical protein
MRVHCIGLLSLCFCAAACAGGGSGTGGECGKIKGCGGDIVGTWTVEELCFSTLDAIFPDLQGQAACLDTIKSSKAKPTGSYTFDKSGNSTVDLTFSVDVETVFSAPCLSALAGTSTKVDAQTCADVEASNQGQQGIAGISCKVAKEGCSCLITSADLGGRSSGPYSINGSNLVLGSTSGPYCVDGDTLHLVKSGSGLSGTLTMKRKK